MHSCHPAHSCHQGSTSVVRKVAPLTQLLVLTPLEQLSPQAFCRTLSPPSLEATLLGEIDRQTTDFLHPPTTANSPCPLSADSPGDCMGLAAESQVHVSLGVSYIAA